MVSVVGEEGVAGVGDEGTTGVEVDGVGKVGKEGEVGVSDVPEKLSEEGVSVRGKVGVTKETTEVVGLCSVEEEGRIVGEVFPQDTKLRREPQCRRKERTGIYCSSFYTSKIIRKSSCIFKSRNLKSRKSSISLL